MIEFRRSPGEGSLKKNFNGIKDYLKMKINAGNLHPLELAQVEKNLEGNTNVKMYS